MKHRTDLHKVRPDMISRAVLLSMSVFMIIRIIMVYMIGESGVGMLGAPFEVYAIGCGVFLYSYERAVDSMIRLRSRREQYLNAEYGMKIAMKWAFCSGMITGILILCLSIPLARIFFEMPKGYLALAVSGICIILMSVQGAMRGYLLGFGAPNSVLHSMMLQSVSSIILSAVLAQLFYRYGLRVNAILRQEDCAPAYGALGVMCGMALSLLLNFLYCLVIYKIRKGQIRDRINNGAPRYLDSHVGIGSNLKALITITTVFSFLTLVDQKIYFVFAGMRKNAGDLVANWGIYYGSYMGVVFLIAFICTIFFVKGCYQFSAQMTHSDITMANEQLGAMIHYQTLLLIPVTAFTAIMAEPIQTAFFGIPNDSAVGMTSFGSMAIFFVSFALTASCVMLRLRKTVIVVVNVLLSAFVHIAVLLMMTIIAGLGLHAVILAVMAMLAFYDLVSLMELSKMIHYRQELLRTFAVTLISAGAGALVIYFLNGVLIDLIGEILSIFVCLITGMIIYGVLLIVLRGISEYELYAVPGGSLYISLAKKLHLMG